MIKKFIIILISIINYLYADPQFKAEDNHLTLKQGSFILTRDKKFSIYSVN